MGMVMEAVSIDGSFDVLKLVYCQPHRYLGEDEMEKKILIRKWKMSGHQQDDPPSDEGEEDGAGGEDDEEDGGSERKKPKGKRVLQKPGAKKRGRGGALKQEETAASARSGIDADLYASDFSSTGSSSAGGGNSSDFTSDEEGRRVRKVKAYMCADCGSMKRSHICEAADGTIKRKTNKRKSKKRRTEGGGSELHNHSTLQQQEASQPMEEEQERVPPTFPNTTLRVVVSSASSPAPYHIRKMRFNRWKTRMRAAARPCHLQLQLITCSTITAQLVPLTRVHYRAVDCTLH
jgi:hypothetical protein